MRKEPDIMRGEALKLQGRAETSRRRARDRRPNRSKEQVRICRLHATLVVAFLQALIATADSRVAVATRVGLKALGLDHLPEGILRHVQISPNWAYLLRAEIKKVQAQLLKLDEAHLSKGKRKRGDNNKYIFDNGIKGVRRVMNKHGTVTGLQQVDHSCPTGLHWVISPPEHSRPNIKAKTHEWTFSLPPDKYKVSLTDTYSNINFKILTDVRALLTWSLKTPFPFTSLPTSVYSTGPWTKHNLVTAVEFLCQRNAYHPFAQCSNPQKHSDPVPLTNILPKKVGTTITNRNMLHYCPHQACASLNPDNFCFKRKEVNNMDFLDTSKIFSYRTIGLGETIRNPIKTFREFSRYVGRMENRKASGDDKMPTDLFKKAPKEFRKRAWIMIYIILAGHYVCSEKLLEARVVLLGKDNGNPTL